MPTITLHRTEHAVLSRKDALARWVEVGFDPAPELAATSPNGMRRLAMATSPIAVRVPPGARVSEVTTKDGRTLRRLVRGDDGGIDAAAVLYLAQRGEAGFRVEEEDMGRKRRDDGPVLFSELTDWGETAHWPDERPGPYGKPVEIRVTEGGPEAFERMRGVIRAELLEEVYRSAIERAYQQLRAALEDDDQMSRCATARAILEEALEGATA